MADESASAADSVERYYEVKTQHEWERQERHPTEFAVTRRALARYLPPPPARILDCGGGPGRYAVDLARQGYHVTLFDLSAACLDLARHKAREAGVTLAAYEKGTAVDLSRFAAGSFDAVLLMGPLYHLLDAGERRQAVAEATRVLKPGGPLLATFITRYSVLRYAAANEPLWIVEHPDLVRQLLDTGDLPPHPDRDDTFVAHFSQPTEVAPLLWGAGLELVTVLGVEGLVSMIETGVKALEGPAWEAWLDLNERVAPDPSLHSGTEHLLAVAVKPRWRTVLRGVARLLNEAGVPFLADGGTSIALHGVPIPVNDLDLTTDARSAYRLGAVLAEHTVEPVALRETDTYRSHLGRFRIDGVLIEVIGDLYRRERGAWQPIRHANVDTLDLDGVPVRVPWLEEETLSYIRRGRLDRAARCLPYCDPARLRALLDPLWPVSPPPA